MLLLFNHLWNKLAKQATRSGLRRSSSRRNPVRLDLEILEDRQVPSAVSLTGGVLTVNLQSPNATATERLGDDTITIGVTTTGGVTISITDSKGVQEENQSYAPGAIKQIQAFGSSSGNDTWDVLKTLSGVPLTITEAAGPAVVNIGATYQNLSFIQGKVTVEGINDLALNIEDQTGGGTYTVTGSQVTSSDSAAPIVYSGVSFLNLYGGTTYNIQNTKGGNGATDVFTSVRPSTVNVLGTTGLLQVVGGGPLTVNVGNQGKVQGINSSVFVTNPSSSATTMTVDDHADTTARTVTVSAGSVNSEGSAYDTWESIQGLTPTGAIDLEGAVNSLTIITGTARNTVNVQSTVYQTYLVDYGPTTVNLGDNGTPGNIKGPLFISNAASQSSINIDVHLWQGIAEIVTVNESSFPGWGTVTGLFSGLGVYYQYAGTAKLSIELNTDPASSVDVLNDGGVPTYVNGVRK